MNHKKQLSKLCSKQSKKVKSFNKHHLTLRRFIGRSIYTSLHSIYLLGKGAEKITESFRTAGRSVKAFSKILKKVDLETLAQVNKDITEIDVSAE